MSTYHIMLSERRQLRLSREDWRLAVFEFCALAMRLATDCSKIRGGDSDSYPAEEFLPILTNAVPFASEYVDAFPSDLDIAEVRSKMLSMIQAYRDR